MSKHTTTAEFPTFYEWITGDEDRERDYGYEAVNALDSSGMTGDASKIIRDHADSAASDFSNNVDAEDIDARAAEDFMDGYEFETYHGPDRAALIHWAWNSDMDLTELGPLEGDNIWEQIEHITWYRINTATHHALTAYAEQYEAARQEWTARQPCVWSYSWEDDGIQWWDCETHGDTATTKAPDAEPNFPCDSADTTEQEAAQ